MNITNSINMLKRNNLDVSIFCYSGMDAREKYVKSFLSLQTEADDWSAICSFYNLSENVAKTLTQCEVGLLTGSLRSIIIYGQSPDMRYAVIAKLFSSIGCYIRDRHDLESAEAAGTADNLVMINGGDIADIIKQGNNIMYHVTTATLMGVVSVDRCPGGNWAEKVQDILSQRIRTGINLWSLSTTPRKWIERMGDTGMTLWQEIVASKSLIIDIGFEPNGAKPAQQ